MKLLTGWVMLGRAGSDGRRRECSDIGAKDTGSSPYAAASDVAGPYAAMPPGSAAARRTDVAAGAGGLHGRARERVFAARIPQQRGFVLYDRRDRSRRRRRPAGDRRPQRADRPLRAGRPDGRQFRWRTDGQFVPAGPLPPVSEVRAYRDRRPRSRRWQAARRLCRYQSGAATRQRAEAGRSQSPAPEPTQQSAGASPGTQPARDGHPAAPQVASPRAEPEAKPAAPPILPTQEMPKVQGLDKAAHLRRTRVAGHSSRELRQQKNAPVFPGRFRIKDLREQNRFRRRLSQPSRRQPAERPRWWS